MLDLIADATDAGWSLRGACRELELGEGRAYRWLERRAAGELADRAPGGSPMHGLLDDEVAEIVALYHEWGDVDRSHRKLAYRGSYLERVWVSPASVRRVLAAQGLYLNPPPRPGHSVRKPFPEWVEYRPNQIWIYDTTHFTPGQVLPDRGRGPGQPQMDRRHRLVGGDLHAGRDRLHRRAGCRRSPPPGRGPSRRPGGPDR